MIDAISKMASIIMKDKTKADYIKLAEHFIKKRLINKHIDVTERSLRLALIASSIEYRPAYWRRLRCALVAQQIEAGFPKTAARLKDIQNPVTLPSTVETPNTLKKKEKQKRCKRVKNEEHHLLKSHINKKEDRALLAAIEVARILGCRPAEMQSLQFQPKNEIIITGAKKTENGLRGLDRTLLLSDDDYQAVQHAFNELHEIRSSQQVDKATFMKRLQHRLATATKNIWPDRKHRITLYSYRHQKGSDLKGSGKSRSEIAAIMGHQSVDSVDVYGSKKTSQRYPEIKATQGSINAVRKTALHHAVFLSKANNLKQLRRP